MAEKLAVFCCWAGGTPTPQEDVYERKSFMFYLICYDVSDDSRRNKISKLLAGYGLRVQKSVFEAMLTENEYEKLQKRLSKLLNTKEDQLRFYPLSVPCQRKVKVLGMQSEFSITDEIVFV